MCGITGYYNSQNSTSRNPQMLTDMVGVLNHRGPDDTGYFHGDGIALGQSRLSIIDIAGGKQPIHNEDQTVWVVFNGEIFNYIELRDELIKKGHHFYTQSDTEAIVHAYEEFGYDFFNHLNGQFAIAIWDGRQKKLVIGRDRVGIRPLFYSRLDDGTFLFGSEIKAIFKFPGFKRELDAAGIDQIFTYWVNVPPRTVFKNVYELPPAHFLVIDRDGLKTERFWSLSFPGATEYSDYPIEYYEKQLQELIYDATTLRLRADVPVASYLSGGIDSSIISALVKKYHNNDLITFSVAFRDGAYDERTYQNQMVNFLNTDHRSIEVDYRAIGDSFVKVVWYAEKPMIRTAPGPLFSLSKLVRDNGIKVVLTGEGADEVFGGYNIFKEDKIRRFWAKAPESSWRPMLLSKLYPYINTNGRASNPFWQNFFKKNLEDVNNPFYSHLIRWENTSHIKQFFAPSFFGSSTISDLHEELRNYLHPDFSRWHPLSRAQYLEMQLFMSGYLLSSQGDRMMMGNSVEGRFPYLDYRVIEFANQIPPRYKISALNEKYILKKTFENLIPADIVYRSKQPYRAPITQCFFEKDSNELIRDLTSESMIGKYGYFDLNKVRLLFSKMSRARTISARDDMAMVAIVSTQLLHHHFIQNFEN